MKIGFHVIGDETWQAGGVHLGNVLRALRTMEGNRVEVCLLASRGDGHAAGELGGLVDEIVTYPPVRR